MNLKMTSHHHVRLTVLMMIILLIMIGLVSPAHRPLPHAHAASPGDAYILAPASRTLAPVSVNRTNGSVTNPNNVLSGQPTRISGSGSYLTLDFGKEVGGIVTLTFAGASGANQSVGLAFSESSIYIGTNSDASNGGGGADGAIFATVSGASTYTMPANKLRGGFRYLTIFMNSSGWVDLNRVSLAYSISPTMSVPNAYPNYFYSNDDLLNRIWYAGAYTVQTNLIAPNQGRVWGPPGSGWDNGATVGVGTTVLVDGAKRDRTIWPGDMGIAVPTAYVSLGDTLSAKNSLTTLYNMQKTTGELPYAGPQVNFFGSDTYHMWTLAGTSSYYIYSGDKAWLDSIWGKYKLGISFITAKINGNGLLNVTGANDWARGGQGGENIAANALLYHVLSEGAYLAQVEGDTALANSYSTQAANLKTQINNRLWNATVGAYRDNPASTLHPQDGNSLAIWYGVVDTPAKAQRISAYLAGNGNPYGARTPEWGMNIGTFPGSMQVMAHLAAGDDQASLDLIKREWGYMLNSPNGTASTFWEGFNADGSFAYGGAYMSLAHGWATGPTPALTFYVLGIQPDTANGLSYHVIPHPGNLTHVEGKLTMAAGKAVSATYDVGAATFSMTVDSSSNTGSSGVIGIPRFGMNHVVTINGATAWNGTAFVGSPGIASADQDANYIYFRGVQPGSRTFAYSDGASNWTNCANENATCSFSGTMRVRFGAGTSYTYRTVTSSTVCNVASFGDPIYGTVKHCDYQPTSTPPGGWTSCAGENGTCSFSGTMVVRYGANNSWNYRTATGSIACNNATFGDPIAGTVKGCYYAPPPTSGWTLCASENGTCSVSGTVTVAYGANSSWAYRTVTNSVACNNATFGDPISGVVKGCYYR